MTEATLRFRVRYAETDAMGVAHHGSYSAWLEMGRVDFLDKLGLPYREVEARGVGLVVVNLGLRYRRPARFDDELVLATRLASLRSRLVRFEYELSRGGEPVASGSTEHVAVMLSEGGWRTVPLPAFLRAALEPGEKGNLASRTASGGVLQ